MNKDTLVSAGLVPGVVFTHASCAKVDPVTRQAVVGVLQRFELQEDYSAVPLPDSDLREPTVALSGGMVYR